MKLTLVSDRSPLSSAQCNFVIELYNDLEFSRLYIPSVNDLDSKMGSASEFNIDVARVAVTSNEADLFVCSLNSLPYPLPCGLQILALINYPDNIDSSSLLAVVGKADRNDLVSIFEDLDLRQKWGRVDIVGFGAGNYNLLTIKGLELIKKADTIFYDDLIDDDYLSQFPAEKIYVGKRKGAHSSVQSAINELVYNSAIAGNNVVRLKGGDPLLFGRGAEEFHYLQSRLVEAEITPGITSAFAAAAQYAIPLTERDLSSSVTLMSGHNIDKMIVPKSDTLVFYMGASNQQAIAQKLIREGLSGNTAVAIIKDASYSHSQAVRLTLDELAANSTSLGSPAIIIVGDVTKIGSISSNRWLYTGTQVDDYEGDATIVHSPLIAIEPYDKTEDIDKAISELSSFNRIVFTSRYAVLYFFNRLYANDLDVRSLALLSITSIGKSTSQELKKHGLVIPPILSDQSSPSILKFFKINHIAKEKILIPRSNLGLDVLPNGLRELNNDVFAIPIYHNVMPEAVVKHNLTHFEGVIFTSPSTINNFIRLYGQIPAHLKVVCRGVETQKQLDNLKRD